MAGWVRYRRGPLRYAAGSLAASPRGTAGKKDRVCRSGLVGFPRRDSGRLRAVGQLGVSQYAQKRPEGDGHGHAEIEYDLESKGVVHCRNHGRYGHLSDK